MSIFSKVFKKKPSKASLILNKDGIPHNPMINAGAIMVCSQIEKEKEPSRRFNTIKSFYSKMAGNKNIGFDNSIFLSEC